jgi:hypothetical protein
MKIEYAARLLIFLLPSLPVGRLVKEDPEALIGPVARRGK